MNKEYYHKQLDSLQTDGSRDDVIRLCREYEKFCRKNGDIDELDAVLETLITNMGAEKYSDEERRVFDDLLELRKALAQHDFEQYGQSYAHILHRKSFFCWCDIDEAISCHQRAIYIYKLLGLYDERGFDIDYEDVFGYLGKLYCYKGNYKLGIRYTATAVEHAKEIGECDFLIGIFYRRLTIAYLSLDDTETARGCIQNAQKHFMLAEQADPDPYAFPEINESCRQLLKECDGRRHTDEYYQQWLIG